MADSRAQLVHIAVDRRLGHEWDEWDGSPLPRGGDFTSSPGLFFAYAALSIVVAAAALSAVVFLIGPRLAPVWVELPRLLMILAASLGVLGLLWLGVLGLSFVLGRRLLPERLAERGPFLKLMSLTSQVARRLGQRDRVENSAVQIYNRLAGLRSHRVGKGELLVLIPRCLSKATLDGVLSIAARHEVPVFVATRGQLARRAIRERRPRAVVAVACERDMVTGLRDVAGRVPVLGLTMSLPEGPCKDAVVDLDRMERWIRGYLT